jgi:hypothetical protein
MPEIGTCCLRARRAREAAAQAVAFEKANFRGKGFLILWKV